MRTCACSLTILPLVMRPATGSGKWNSHCEMKFCATATGSKFGLPAKLVKAGRQIP